MILALERKLNATTGHSGGEVARMLGASMTVMFDRYFAIPQRLIRDGFWAQMKPTEQSLYVCLMHESERYSTRSLSRADAVLCSLTGLSSRSFCNARKKLQERGLVLCNRERGNIYRYIICDPETGKPWPGDPKQKIQYQKKGSSIGASPSATSALRSACSENSANPDELRHHGVQMEF